MPQSPEKFNIEQAAKAFPHQRGERIGTHELYNPAQWFATNDPNHSDFFAEYTMAYARWPAFVVHEIRPEHKTSSFNSVAILFPLRVDRAGDIKRIARGEAITFIHFLPDDPERYYVGEYKPGEGSVARLTKIQLIRQEQHRSRPITGECTPNQAGFTDLVRNANLPLAIDWIATIQMYAERMTPDGSPLTAELIQQDPFVEAAIG